MAALGLLDPEAVRLDPRQAAARFAHAPGDPLGQLDVGRVEVDVPGDQERPGADRDGAGPRVHPCGPEVRLAPVVRDLDLEPLVLAPPDVGQLDAVRAGRGLGIEVDGELVAGARSGAPKLRASSTQSSIDVSPSGTNGIDIHRADPRVLAAVLLHVDVVDRCADQAVQAGDDGVVLAGDREHGAVVAGVRGPVQQEHAGDRCQGVRETLHDIETAAFGDVGHAFDEHVPKLQTAPRPAVRAVKRGAPRLRVDSAANEPTRDQPQPAAPARLPQAVDGQTVSVFGARSPSSRFRSSPRRPSRSARSSSGC